MSMKLRLTAVVLVLLAAATDVRGDTLRIGAAVPITSIDPHFHNLTPNIAASKHIFDTLILQDAAQRLQPGLALSWQPIGPTTWEIKLRPDVKWHDGQPLTSHDVVFTLKRAPAVPNSPGSFATFTRQIVGVKALDERTLHIETKSTYPLLPNDLTQLAVISVRAEGRSTQDFNSGAAAIGTGPYRFVRWVPGERLELERNDDYWGDRQPWTRVLIRFIPNAAARVAALLAGDVDMIDAVPTTDVSRLEGNKTLAIARTTSNRVIFLNLDGSREVSPFVHDLHGQPLKPNPLKDERVRQAISLAIDRDLIVKRVMEGYAIPAAQLVPPGFFGASLHLRATSADIEAAKRLMEAAGNGGGFALTLHTPNDRYINDAKIAQAIAQMLARIGIRTNVEAMPYSVFATRSSARNPEFSVTLNGWGSASGESSVVLTAVLQTYNRTAGTGSSNRGHYSNPVFDGLIDKAKTTTSGAERQILLEEAMEIGIKDAGVIPLHFQMNVWATRANIRYEARTDENTLAMSAASVK